MATFLSDIDKDITDRSNYFYDDEDYEGNKSNILLISGYLE